MINVASKRWPAFVAMFFLMTASAFAGVTVSSPAPGATAGSPVQFAATASGTYPISAIRIYVDGNSTYTVNASSLNTSLGIAAGGHSIVVQAWDTTGAVYKQPLTVIVGSGTTSTTDSAATTIISSIQKMAGWESCTVCAGLGGNGPEAQYGYSQGVASPSLSGGAMEFF